MVEDNSSSQALVFDKKTVVVSPRLRTQVHARARNSWRAEHNQSRSDSSGDRCPLREVSERGVRVAQSAMNPPSLHPEPGRAPWQRRRVLRG